MSDETRPDWVGQRAVAWVIDHAPVPADLAWTLVVIARRCDDNGRGSYQSTSTVATKTGKSAKQAQRDIVQLRELGLIVLGDQSLVAHLPVGQRPTVYDVPMHVKGPKPIKESRNKSGGKKGPSNTPPMDGTPPMQGTPPTGGESTPPMHAPRTPPMDGDQRTPMNNPVEERSGVECLPSGRFAPSGPGDEFDDHEPLILEAPTTKSQGFADWRAEDLDLLAATIGSRHVVSDGSVSKVGTYPVRAVYDSLRAYPGSPKEWPGKYLAAIAENYPDSGVTDWLARYGLEPA